MSRHPLFSSFRFSVGLLLSGLLAACMTPQKQLERVAKDWCMTIRASQVIPVYPLSEDIQPGDIYLVSTPLPQQVALWKSKGFLPLEQQIFRIHPVGYQDYYLDGYGSWAGKTFPTYWQFPKGSQTEIAPASTSDPTAWSLAPQVCFPTYSFRIDEGGGMNMALPIQGVPVAFSALGARSATASVSIKNSQTYGLPEAVLSPQIEAWAYANRDYLSRYQPRGKGEFHYLRAITRVYLAKSFNVTVTNDESYSAQASGGAPKPVENIVFQSKAEAGSTTAAASSATAVSNAASGLIPTPGEGSSLSKLAEGVIPGGTMKVTAASSRSISLIEELRRPVVVGYLAMEYLILPEGYLGQPVATLAAAKGDIKPSSIRVFSNYKASSTTERLRSYEKVPQQRANLSSWLKRHLPNVDGADFVNDPNYESARLEAIKYLGIP